MVENGSNSTNIDDKAVKYVVVTGGVISGVGKGIIASSTGVLLRALSQRVTAIKIDPYLNVDAGTLSPLDHGEVFVLEDGGEVDLDLGNYERFLDVTLGKDNNLTMGKVYEQLIQKERRGDYLGRTVQVVPHVTDHVQAFIERVSQQPVHAGARTTNDFDTRPDVCIIELGGTVGDIESAAFVEALRQFQARVGRENLMLIHVCLVPTIGSSECPEQKTKPAQMSVRDLRAVGLIPDVVACRSTTPLTPSVRSKISMFCDVRPEQIMAVHDCSSVYHVPMLLAEQGFDSILAKRLNLTPNPIYGSTLLDANYFQEWARKAHNLTEPIGSVRIALVGKYTHHHDSYMSIVKALQHAGMSECIDVEIHWIEAADLEDFDPNAVCENMKPVESILSNSVTSLASINLGTISESHTAIANHKIMPDSNNKSSTSIMVPVTSTAAIETKPIHHRRSASSLTVPIFEHQNKAHSKRHAEAWKALRSAHGVIVPGGFGGRGTEGKIAALKYARESNLPVLGICLGFQLAVVEHARHVLGLEKANSVELDPDTPFQIVVSMPEVSSTKLGGTMRLGARPTSFVTPKSKSQDLYGGLETIYERHRHRFEVNPAMVELLEQKGLLFVGKDSETRSRMEILERKDHPFFVATQFHPEFLSRPLRPAPLFLGLVRASYTCSTASLDCN